LLVAARMQAADEKGIVSGQIAAVQNFRERFLPALLALLMLSAEALEDQTRRLWGRDALSVRPRWQGARKVFY